MKKIEGYANANDAPDVILWAKDQLPPGLTKPALLLISEDGEQLPEVMTKEEVRSMLLDVALAADRHYERQRADDPFEFRRKLWAAVSKHGITL